MNSFFCCCSIQLGTSVAVATSVSAESAFTSRPFFMILHLILSRDKDDTYAYKIQIGDVVRDVNLLKKSYNKAVEVIIGHSFSFTYITAYLGGGEWWRW